MGAQPKQKTKERYAAVPARAILDKSLSAEHLRVLMAIAVHDGMSRNGYGCTASHTTLAELTGCHIKSLSRTIKFLIESGYIAESKVLGKLRVYRVNYTDADHILVNRQTGNKSATREQNSTADVIEMGSRVATADGRTGNKPAEVYQQYQWDAEDKISCINNKNLKYPAEAASPYGDAMAENGDWSPEDRAHAQFLREVEQWLRDAKQRIRARPGSVVHPEDRADLISVETQLWKVAEAYDHVTGDRLGGWAYRLMLELSDIMPEAGS